MRARVFVQALIWVFMGFLVGQAIQPKRTVVTDNVMCIKAEPMRDGPYTNYRVHPDGKD